MTTLSTRVLRDPWVVIATGFGCGFSPIAPGTVGSLFAIPFWWWLLAPLAPLVQAIALTLIVVGAVLVASHVCRSNAVEDDQAIVLDEIVGTWIALCAAPRSFLAVAAGVALFRFFDIVKPWPISWVERRFRGGLGVMMDDVAAGVLAAIVLELSLAAGATFGVAP